MTRLLDSQFHFGLLEQPPRWLFPAIFALTTFTGFVAGVRGMQSAPTRFHLALIVIGGLSALLSALGTTYLYALLFTWLSQRLGASTAYPDVRLLAALSLIPTSLGLLLMAVTGVGLFAALGGLLAAVIFIYGLSLTNGTDLLAALRHTLAVWGLIILVVVGVQLLARMGHHQP